MNLSENVAKLQTLLPSLKASDAKFASDLIASFKKYGGLTPKQAPWIEKLIARAVTPAFQVVFSSPVIPAAVNVGNFAGVQALFTEAQKHLKFPKIRLQVEGKKIILILNGPQSKKPGFVNLVGEGKYPNRSFYGSVSPEGVFTPAQATYGSFGETLTKLLSDLSANPARVAKEYGKLTGHCCFCGKGIGYGKEERSALVGFGPDCAEHYGLKAEWLAAAEKAEAKASVAVPTVATLPSGSTTVCQSAEAAAKLEAAAAKFAWTQPVAEQPLSPHVQAAVDAGIAQSDAEEAKSVLTPEMTDAGTAQLNAEAFLLAQQQTAINASKEKLEALLEVPVVSLTVTPAAQAQIEALAQGIESAKQTLVKAGEWTGEGSPEYWSKVGESIESYGPQVNPDEQQAELGPEYAKVPLDAYQVTGIDWADTGGDSVVSAVPPFTLTVLNEGVCFFCEETYPDTQVLHGYTVCALCVAQLKG